MRSLYLLLAGYLLILFSACTTLYVPSNNHTHLMTEKGEIHLAAAGGAHGFSLLGGYAITDQYGIVAAISGRETESNNGNITETHEYAEIGFNYFGFEAGPARGEITVGFGGGSGERGNSRGDYIKPYFQFNTAVTSRLFDTGVSLRTAYVGFTELEVDNDRPRDSSIFFEPAFFARMGYRNVKLESQLGFAYPLSDSGEFAFGYEPIRMSVGVKVHFNTR